MLTLPFSRNLRYCALEQLKFEMSRSGVGEDEDGKEGEAGPAGTDTA